MRRSLRRTAGSAVVALLLAGCSSGSGGTASTTTSAPPIVTPAPGAVGTLAEVTALIAASTQEKQLPKDLTPPLVNLAADSENVYKDGCEAQDHEATVKTCEYGDPKGTKLIVLLGDSHAGMWHPAVDAAAKRAGWRLVLLSKPGCPSPDLSFYDLQENRTYPECEAWHSYTRERIATLKPDAVVISSAYFAPKKADGSLVTPSEWSDGLAKTLNDLPSTAKRYVLGDIPYLSQVAPDCLAAHQDDARKCATPPGTAVKSDHVKAERDGAARGLATYIDVQSWFCASTCPAVAANIAIYRNQFHITTVYAKWLSGVLADAIGLSSGSGARVSSPTP
jgi:hypothetical protein